MKKYKLKFFFEHGGICIWSANDLARNKYGYAIETDELPISHELINELWKLEDEYSTYLDWECPSNPSPWTYEHKIDFIKRATEAYISLCSELDHSFEVENHINNCVL